MLLTSCATTKTSEKVYVPELDFPKFPKLELAEKGITVSEEWIVRMAEYKIQIEETEKTYNQIKELYENETDRICE